MHNFFQSLAILIQSNFSFFFSKLIICRNVEKNFTPSNLSGLFREIGYNATSTNEIISEIFSSVESVTESDLAQLIGMMITTHSGLDSNSNSKNVIATSIMEHHKKDSKMTTWNLDNMISFLKKKVRRRDFVLKFFFFFSFQIPIGQKLFQN